MKLRFSIGLLILVTLTAIAPCRATDPAPSPADVPVTDPAAVAAQYRQVLEEPQFQPVPEPETRTNVKEWLARWFTQLGTRFERLKYTQQIPRFASLLISLFVLLCLIGLLYVLARVTRRRGRWSRSLPEEPPLSGRTASPESLEEELRRASADGDWRRAWLVTWRQFLSRLERRHLVEADRSRTNREYLRQLEGQVSPAPALGIVTRLVDAYDLCIYGRRDIAESDWREFREQVNEATLLLHAGDAEGGL